MLDFVVDELRRISGATCPKRHLRLAALHRSFDNRLRCKLPSGEKRHAGFQHVVVSLGHHFGGFAVGAEVTAAVFISVVVALGLIFAVLGGAIVWIAEADNKFARCVVEAVLVEA